MMDRRQFIINSTVAGIVGAGLSGCSSLVPNSSSSTIEKSKVLSFEERQKWLSSFACNIEMWFEDLDFLDRITAAKKMGFNAVEMWNPRKKKLTPEQIAERAREEGIRVTSISPGAPALADIANLSEFLEWADWAIEVADLFDVPNFNLTGHETVQGKSIEQMIETYTHLIKLVAPKFESANKIATIEPYNPFNHKGHFIYGVEPGLSICREVNSPSIKLNWDFFHMQRTNGNLITHLENGIDQVGYVQVADSPDRFQPSTGEVSYSPVLNRLRQLGYKGYIGAECFPENKDELTAASDLAIIARNISLQSPNI